MPGPSELSGPKLIRRPLNTRPGMREACKHPLAARPSPESMAVDVFATIRHYEYLVEVLSDYSQTMNRYAFLLIE